MTPLTLDVGLLWFQQGDIVWVRDIDATVVSPDGDNLQAFVLHPCVLLLSFAIRWRLLFEQWRIQERRVRYHYEKVGGPARSFTRNERDKDEG